MEFNKPRKNTLNVQQTVPHCNTCKAFIAMESEEGVCILNPPQVVVEAGELYSSFPTVNGETMYCLQHKPIK